MKKAQEKFLDYLNELEEKAEVYYEERLKKEYIEFKAKKKNGRADRDFVESTNLKRANRYLLDAKNLKRILLKTPKEAAEANEIFGDWDILSDFLIVSPLNIREKLQIMKAFVQQNKNSGFLDDTKHFIIDFIYLKDEDLNYITVDEIQDLVARGEIRDLLYGDEELLSDLELKQREEILQHLPKCIDYCTLRRRYNQFIYKHLNCKETTFTKSDVNFILYGFRRLGVKPELLAGFERYLKSTAEKNERRNNAKVSAPIVSAVVESKKATKCYFTEKDISTLKKELLSMYDIYNHVLIRQLTETEKCRVISILILLGYQEIAQDRFLSLCTNQKEQEEKLKAAKQKVEVNPIEKYQENRERYAFYAEEDAIQCADELLEEAMNATEESYKDWVALLEEYYLVLEEEASKDKKHLFEKAKALQLFSPEEKAVLEYHQAKKS